MPTLTDSVGLKGADRLHDLAVIRAALKKIKGRDGRPYFTGSIRDARNPYSTNDKTNKAILAFQKDQGVKNPSGCIKANDTSLLNAIESKLPSELKGMFALTGTFDLAVRSGAAPNVIGVNTAVIEGLPLTGEYRLELITVLSALARKLPISLLVTDMTQANDAAPKIAISMPGVRFLNDQLQPQALGVLPQRVKTHFAVVTGKGKLFKYISRGQPEILVSRQPLYLPRSAFGLVPAGHKLLDASGINALHNQAALKAALLNVKDPSGQPFWSKDLNDGTPTDAAAAVKRFQVAARLRPTGKFDGPTEQALLAALPKEMKRIRGLKGTSLALVRTGASPAGASADTLFIGVPQEKIHPTRREGLKKLAVDVRQSLDLPLRISHFDGPDATLTLDFADTVFLARNGKPYYQGEMPSAAVDQVVGLARKHGLDIFTGGPGVSALKMMMRLPMMDAEDIQVDAVYQEEPDFAFDPYYIWRTYPEDMARLGISPDMVATALYSAEEAAVFAARLGLKARGTKVYIQDGKYIVIKGYAGLRAYLQGTRYLSTNSKMLIVGLASNATKGADVIGKRLNYIALVVTIGDELDQVRLGEQTLGEAAVGVGMGMSKTYAAGAFATLIGGAILAGGAPVLAAVGVAIVVAFLGNELLNIIDDRLGLTKAFKDYIKMLGELGAPDEMVIDIPQDERIAP